MKKLVDDPRLIYKCCDLYYRQEKSQQEICDLFGVSRPSVSRMLKSGRELGIVRIEIVNPDATAYGQLERQLEDAFSLKEAIVVCDSPSQSGAETGCGALGSAALSYLARVLHNGDYVGISMGWTLLHDKSGVWESGTGPLYFYSPCRRYRRRKRNARQFPDRRICPPVWRRTAATLFAGHIYGSGSPCRLPQRRSRASRI